MIFQVLISKKEKGLRSTGPRFLRTFLSDLKKRGGLYYNDPRIFANCHVIFTEIKTKLEHLDKPAGTPGHGLKTGTVPAKPGRMVSLP